MVPRFPSSRRPSSDRVFPASERSLHTLPLQHHSDFISQRGGLIVEPWQTMPPSLRIPVNDGSQRLTKFLMNVNIEKSLGPVHIVISSDKTVNDLIKAAIEIYVKEKRRPLLEETDPKFFELHYSEFSLESLKPEEKLINLGSRNFYLCLRSSSCGFEEAKMASESLFPLTEFMGSLWTYHSPLSSVNERGVALHIYRETSYCGTANIFL